MECLANSIRIDVEWIPRAKNDQADFVSRIFDTDDWSLSEKLFSVINARWGPFTIDCFATFYNA